MTKQQMGIGLAVVFVVVLLFGSCSEVPEGRISKLPVIEEVPNNAADAIQAAKEREYNARSEVEAALAKAEQIMIMEKEKVKARSEVEAALAKAEQIMEKEKAKAHNVRGNNETKSLLLQLHHSLIENEITRLKMERIEREVKAKKAELELRNLYKEYDKP